MDVALIANFEMGVDATRRFESYLLLFRRIMIEIHIIALIFVCIGAFILGYAHGYWKGADHGSDIAWIEFYKHFNLKKKE